MSLETWIIATRPWSLVMTFVSTCLAGILACASGGSSIPIFILTMAGLLIAHIAANMTNDLYDVKHGVDANASTAEYRPHPLLFGELDKKSYKTVIFFSIRSRANHQPVLDLAARSTGIVIQRPRRDSGSILLVR